MKTISSIYTDLSTQLGSHTTQRSAGENLAQVMRCLADAENPRKSKSKANSLFAAALFAWDWLAAQDPNRADKLKEQLTDLVSEAELERIARYRVAKVYERLLEVTDAYHGVTDEPLSTQLAKLVQTCLLCATYTEAANHIPYLAELNVVYARPAQVSADHYLDNIMHLVASFVHETHTGTDSLLLSQIARTCMDWAAIVL